MEITLGTPLIHIMEYIEKDKIASEYKTRILNYCRAELQIGDGKVSNEIELAILQAWLLESDEVRIPTIENNCKLIDTYSFQEAQNIKIFEEYQSPDNTYYVKTITKDNNGNVIRTQLAHRTTSLKQLLSSGGIEDILTDIQGNNIADSRIIQKTSVNEFGIKKLNIYTDVNLDGKFD